MTDTNQLTANGIVQLTYPVLCLVGPTASGKSELAQLICEELDGEVISADSMQIYRGMDIGTGKVMSSEQRVPHFGLDLVDPGEPYSVALYQQYARKCIAEISSRNKVPVLCGGTGLYVRAVIDSYDFAPGEQVDNPVREQYTHYAEEHGAQALWELLRSCDPRSAEVLHPNNVRRVVRAFEMLSEGTCYADQVEQLHTIPQVLPAYLYGLSVTPDILAQRIENRVDAMVERGLVEEVKGLLERGFREGVTAPQAIGYKEIVPVLEEGASLDEAVQQIKTSTRRYAKRQRTWFRKDDRILWLDADEYDAQRLTDAIVQHYRLQLNS